jgi:hypothetical protein
MSNFAQKSFDDIAEQMKYAYFALERLHKSLSADPEDTVALNREKRRLLVQSTKKYIIEMKKRSLSELAQLYRACSVALIDEEAVIRRDFDISPDDDCWELPYATLTSKYIVYDRIRKDAPTLIVDHLKSLCEKAEPSIFLQAVSNCSQWILNCEKRSYLFGLDSVSDADDVKDRWLTQSDFDSIYDDVQSSKYPVEVREWICSQLSYILQD